MRVRRGLIVAGLGLVAILLFAADAGGTLFVQGPSVELRAAPGFVSAISDRLDSGTVVTVLGERDARTITSREVAREQPRVDPNANYDSSRKAIQAIEALRSRLAAVGLEDTQLVRVLERRSGVEKRAFLQTHPSPGRRINEINRRLINHGGLTTVNAEVSAGRYGRALSEI